MLLSKGFHRRRNGEHAGAHVAEGDEAVLFGPGTSGEPTAQDWADLLGTIHYEVVTGPRGRVLRSYRGGDRDGR